MMDFKGKKYVVTGASSGMGKSCAEMLLNEKAVVCGFDRSEGSISHENYTHFQVDITDEDAIKRCLEEIDRRSGKCCGYMGKQQAVLCD